MGGGIWEWLGWSLVGWIEERRGGGGKEWHEGNESGREIIEFFFSKSEYGFEKKKYSSFSKKSLCFEHEVSK